MMKQFAAMFATVAIGCGAPVLAQTTHQTTVNHDTKMHDGVATTTTKVTETSKRRTRQPKRVFGVKYGHKTVVHKTVRKSSVSSNGDHKATVTTH